MSASYWNFIAAALNAAIYVAFHDSALSFISVGCAVFSFGVGIGAAIEEARSAT